MRGFGGNQVHSECDTMNNKSGTATLQRHRTGRPELISEDTALGANEGFRGLYRPEVSSFPAAKRNPYHSPTLRTKAPRGRGTALELCFNNYLIYTANYTR